MPQYHVGHLGRVEAIEQCAAAIPGLHLAGGAYQWRGDRRLRAFGRDGRRAGLRRGLTRRPITPSLRSSSTRSVRVAEHIAQDRPRVLADAVRRRAARRFTGRLVDVERHGRDPYLAEPRMVDVGKRLTLGEVRMGDDLGR